jgi:hypothetical protein
LAMRVLSSVRASRPPRHPRDRACNSGCRCGRLLRAYQWHAPSRRAGHPYATFGRGQAEGRQTAMTSPLRRISVVRGFHPRMGEVLIFGVTLATAQQTGLTVGEDRKFVVDVAQGSLAEVELGKVAALRNSDTVKQFAQRMVADHGKAGDELTRLARQKASRSRRSWTTSTSNGAIGSPSCPAPSSTVANAG